MANNKRNTRKENRRGGNYGSTSNDTRSIKDSSKRNYQYDSSEDTKRRVKEHSKGNGCNDVSWYANNPQLLKDSASLTFSTRTGTNMGLVSPGNNVVKIAPNVQTIPGILRLSYAPSLGRTIGGQNANSAFNVAAKNIYSFIRHANSGSANYEATDLAMAIMATSQAFSAIALGIRAYGVAMVYNQKNTYMPSALLTAMGFDPSSVLNNLAQFRYSINNLIAKASVLWVPNNIPLVTRQFWMNSNVYKDSDSDRSQFYLYVPYYFWKFSGKTSEQGSALNVEEWNNGSISGLRTVDQYVEMVDSLLDPLVSDEDLGIMFGDILKAYGKEHLYTLDMIPENYTVLPTYNYEVLQQIHNSTAYPTTSSVVRQEDGIIKEKGIKLPKSMCGMTFNHILDFENDAPEPAEIMVATRLTTHIDVTAGDAMGSNTTVDVTDAMTCGTERVVWFTLYQFYDDGTLNSSSMYTYFGDALNESTVLVMSRLQKFKHAPIIYRTILDGDATTGTFTSTVQSIHGDLDVYTVVDPNVLSKMHSTAILSEYNVPVM